MDSEEIKSKYAKAEKATDSILRRLAGSEWTLALIAAGVAGAFVAWLVL